MAFDLNVINNNSHLTSKTKEIYKRTVMRLNQSFGKDIDTFDAEFYLNNLERVMEEIENIWTIKNKFDMLTRLNHIQSFFICTLDAEDYVRFSKIKENYVVTADDNDEFIDTGVKTRGIVYLIYSPASMKLYVGSTKCSLSERLANHRSSYNSYFRGDYDAYLGSFEVLKERIGLQK